MRIAYAHPMSLPAPYANTVHVTQMCEAFGKADHDVTLIVPHGGAGDPYAHYGVAPTFRIARAWRRTRVPGNGWLFAAAQQRLLTRLRPDLVYTRHLPSALIAAARGIDVVFEAHGPPSGLGRVDRGALARLLRSPRLKRVTVISDALRDLFLSQLPDRSRLRDLLFVAHDGARTDQRYSAPPDNDPPLAVYTGSFYAGRGVEQLVALAAALPDIRFRLVGCPPESLAEWQARTAELANVSLHPRCPPAEVATHLADADILLAPYQTRVGISLDNTDIAGFFSPLKMFEYMAAGRAIVSGDLPVLREVLDDGRNALLCPSGDIAAWTAALRTLAADRALRHRLGDAARADMLGHYSWDARAGAVIDGLGAARST